MAERPRKSKRRAASLAEDRIRKTIEEVNRWSEELDQEAKSTVCYLENFDDLAGNNKRCRKNSNDDTEHLDECLGDSLPSDDPNDQDSASNAKHPSTKDHSAKRRAERIRRVEERCKHSNRPMMLSRRLSRKLRDPDLSPFSPIVAVRLCFTPDAVSSRPVIARRV